MNHPTIKLKHLVPGSDWNNDSQRQKTNISDTHYNSWTRMFGFGTCWRPRWNIRVRELEIYLPDFPTKYLSLFISSGQLEFFLANYFKPFEFFVFGECK